MRRAFLIAGLAVVYFAAAKIGLSLAFAAEQVTLVWPPTGIALAALIRFGRGVWPGIALGAFLANATANEPLATAAGIALGNTLEAVVGAWLLSRLGFKPTLERFRDVLWLVGYAALISTTVSATIGVTSLCLGGVEPWTRFRTLWLVWWVGDAMGDLIFAPPLLAWTCSEEPRWRRDALAEVAALVGSLAVVSSLLLAIGRTPLLNAATTYVVFPFVIWAALRFEQRGSTLVVLLASTLSTWATVNEVGPFVGETLDESLFLQQSFMAVVAITGLMLAASSAGRKSAERRVRESHRILARISEGTTDAIFVKDLEGRYLMINSGGAALLGKSVAEVIGKDDSQLFSPETAAEIMKRDRITIQEGKTSTFEEVGTAAGATRIYLSTKGPYRDAEGRAIGLLGIARDITYRKEMETAVRASEARYRSLVMASAQVVWMTSTDGKVVEDLPTWREFTGQSEDEMKGWGWMERLHPDDVDATRRVWEASLATGEPHVSEFRVRARDGLYRHVLARAVPVFGSDGEIGEWVGTGTDVTEQKLAEEERSRLLERETALRAAADEANRQKDEFLGLLGHELRNPLAPIRNALAILQQDRRKATLTWALEVMSRQVHHLTRLVDDLLDVSRITRGRIELRRESIDLRVVVERAVEASRPFLDSREHALEVALPDEPVTLFADSTRIEQVVVNLLNNAAKYTERKGHIRTSVQTRGECAVLRVRDDGRGIPTELLPRVFDLFTQADRTLARSEGGLGVGLTLVRKLVTLHGGSVDAESEGPGRGSEFVVTLPLHSAEVSDDRDSVAAAAKAPRQEASSLRVLVVEDNPDSARSLSMLLELLGHEVRVAHDGPSALEAVESFRPAVVLLDIGLPGMDGYEVAQRIRSAGGNPMLVSLSGYGRRSPDAGFDHQLVKPVEPERLLEIFATLG